MSEETTTMIGKIILLIVVAGGSVFGIIIGIVILAWSGRSWGIALIIGSVLLIISAVFGIFRIYFSNRTQRDKKTERKEKLTRRTIIWIVVSIGSGAGAFLFSVVRIGSIWLKFILVAFLVGLCLFAVIVLISGRTERNEEISEIKPPIDVENITEEDQKEELEIHVSNNFSE